MITRAYIAATAAAMLTVTSAQAQNFASADNPYPVAETMGRNADGKLFTLNVQCGDRPSFSISSNDTQLALALQDFARRNLFTGKKFCGPSRRPDTGKISLAISLLQTAEY